MQPSLNFLAVLNLLGAAQGALLALALLSLKRGNRFANRILAALTIAISFVVCGAVLLTTNYIFVFPHLSRLHHPFVFLVGPFLFLYLKTLISAKHTFKKKDFLHFVPSVLCALYLIPYYFLISEHSRGSPGEWYYLRSALFIVQFLVYLALIVSMLIRYSRRAYHESAYSKHVLLQLRFFVGFSTVLWVGAVLRFAFDDGGATNLLVPFGISVLIYTMCYLGLSKPEVFVKDEENAPPPKKYEKSTLLPQWSDRYLSKLLEAMENEKPYTESDLTIQKLATKLSIPSQHLSQVINERLGQSFTDFINSYRVEEAKRRLLDPNLKHNTILAISEEAGFNSKSSFNAVFKKYTNMTPSEYRKNSNGVHQS
jgi:AraC-like DNA-binding protein